METFYTGMQQLQLYIPLTPSIIQFSKVERPSRSHRRDKHWTFKALTGLLPSYSNSLVSFNASLHHTRSKDWLTLQVPYVHPELGKSSFSYCAPATWNTLQNHLKLTTFLSLGQFKSIIASYFKCT